MPDYKDKSTDYREIIKKTVKDEAIFLQMTLSNKLKADDSPWIKIKVRPVLIRGERKLQFSYFDPKKDITKNYSGPELDEQLNRALLISFGQIHIQTTVGDLTIRLTSKGKVSILERKFDRKSQLPDLSNNRVKRYPLAADKPDPLLQAIGIMSKQGKILASMQGKFRQINEFLRIIEHALPTGVKEPVQIIDCGCGSAYLTFATYHYLNHVKHIPAEVVGIDRNPELIAKCEDLRNSLDWTGLKFIVSSISGYVPAKSPTMVLSLHACDTATDEVIAQSILWESSVILAAPCCQHELHQQLKAPLFRPVIRHGILKERLADILTDTFRALILRIMGYKTDIFEFISSEATAKNLMIQAKSGLKPGDRDFVKEYLELKNFWEITPALEKMLGERFQKLLMEQRFQEV